MMNDIDYMINVMTAFAHGYNGIEFKYKYQDDSCWTPITQPTWNWADFDYRIAIQKWSNYNAV